MRNFLDAVTVRQHGLAWCWVSITNESRQQWTSTQMETGYCWCLSQGPFHCFMRITVGTGRCSVVLMTWGAVNIPSAYHPIFIWDKKNNPSPSVTRESLLFLYFPAFFSTSHLIKSVLLVSNSIPASWEQSSYITHRSNQLHQWHVSQANRLLHAAQGESNYLGTELAHPINYRFIGFTAVRSKWIIGNSGLQGHKEMTACSLITGQ